MLKTFKDGGPKADKLLKEMGLSLADLGGKAAVAKMTTAELHESLAKAMGKKGAGPLADMALTLPAILQKAREGFTSLFAKLGPAVKPFMKAVKELFGNFNKGTPIMKFFQGAVTKVFGVLFGWATKAVGALSAVVKWLANSGKAGGMFSGAVAVLKAGWKALVAVFGAVKSVLTPIVAVLKKIFSNALVLRGIKTVLTLIVGAVVVVIVIFATLAAAVGTADDAGGSGHGDAGSPSRAGRGAQ